MTDLSIIIVNYNVRDFLHQCILSIEKAMAHLKVDVWIVDNDSIDGSQKYLKSIEHLDYINVILNTENVGFSTANNQAIVKSDSKYILLLNPDTVVEEDTLIKCYQKMESDTSIGALGVRMIDGAGKFLPESKRGFPSLWASFTKMSGMSKLAPHSNMMNAYYLGAIDEMQEAEIDVLCGAFMFLRSSVLDEVGLLDESFFMYGEDIDWSYRIQQSGAKVYYYPETSIIHYKGESTKKTSLTYLRTFYNAMIIFINKHFKGGSYIVLVGILKLAIYFRASISWIINLIKKWMQPVVDFCLFLSLLFGLKTMWANAYFDDSQYFENGPIYYNILSYVVAWIGSLYVMGNYDQKSDLLKLVKGLLVGFFMILIAYALLPVSFRSSRILILLGLPIVAIGAMITKICFNFVKQRKWDFTIPASKNICIVGERQDVTQVEELLSKVQLDDRVKARISVNNVSDDYFMNDISQLQGVVQLMKINEVIFSSSSMKYGDIFSWMRKLGPSISYKIASQDQDSIIGSSSKNESGEVYTYQFEMALIDKVNRRLKRIFDIVVAFISLILSPIVFVLSGFKWSIFGNIAKVLFGKNTWVGFDDNIAQQLNLPKLKPAVFKISEVLSKRMLNQNEIDRVNMYYARNYSVSQDFEAVLKGIGQHFSNK